MRINLKKVQEFMEQREKSEYTLAADMGVSYSYVFRVMRGERNPGGKFIEGLLKAGMRPEDIFFTNSVTNS